MRFYNSIQRRLLPLLIFLLLAPIGLAQQTGQTSSDQKQAAQSSSHSEKKRKNKDNDKPDAPVPHPERHVVIISIDGMKPDYYTRSAELGIKVPNLTMIKLNGAYANGVEGVYPTVTYPSHTAIVTGANPAVHGIVQNTIFEAPTDPQTGSWYWYSNQLKAETLWQSAKKAGMTIGSVGWPVTVGAEIDYNVPEIWDPADHPISGKRAIENSTPGLIQKIVSAGKIGKGDDFRTSAAEFIIKNYKPNLMLLHLIALDDAQHEFGPLTPKAFETVETEDGYIGRVLQAVKDSGVMDQTTVFIVSDHGFAAISKKFEPDVVLVKAGLITLGPDGKPTSWKAAAWPDGGSCAIVLKDPEDKETDRKVTEIFTKLVGKDSSPLNRVVARKELNKMEAIPQAAIMLEGNPGYSFGQALTGPSVHESGPNSRGTHGYLPSRVEMRASLMIYGEAAKVGGQVTVARMVDIGPTVASILGVELADAEGHPIPELVKPSMIPPPPPGEKKNGSKKKKKNETH